MTICELRICIYSFKRLFTHLKLVVLAIPHPVFIPLLHVVGGPVVAEAGIQRVRDAAIARIELSTEPIERNMRIPTSLKGLYKNATWQSPRRQSRH